MTIIKIRNAVSIIEGPRSDIFEADKALATEVAGAFWARKRRPGWDGKWHPVNVLNGRFPTGLLWRVRQALPLATVVNERVGELDLAPATADILPGLTLRDYQVEAIKAPELAGVHGRGIIAVGTGGGKTEIAIAFGCRVPGLCLWIVHRKDLLHQTAERIEKYLGEKPSIIGDGSWSFNADRKFCVAMPQTAARTDEDFSIFLQEVGDASVLVLDEVHRTASAKAWYKMAQSIPAYWRLGLTGTPDTGDPVRNLRLEATTGPVIYTMKTSDLAKEGFAVPAKVQFHKIQNDGVAGDYREARRILIEQNRTRNSKIIDIALAATEEGKRVLIICDTIGHVRRIGEVMASEGVRSRVLTGKHAAKVRSKARKDLRSGALEVLLATPIFDEGIDLPELDVVILAAGGKSAVRLLQRIGRALRLAPGKKYAEIHDFWDTGSRYTLKHSNARMNACRKEGFEILGGGK